MKIRITGSEPETETIDRFDVGTVFSFADDPTCMHIILDDGKFVDLRNYHIYTVDLYKKHPAIAHDAELVIR